MDGIEKIVVFKTYKMIKISAQMYETKSMEVILADNDTLWLNQKHVEEKLGYNNLPVITNKYDPIYKTHRYGLIDQPNDEPSKRFWRNDYALKVIMDRRTDELCNLKKRIGFNLHDVINTKRQAVLKSMK